jgi:predicted RNA-binding Zn ribbon-like protein
VSPRYDVPHAAPEPLRRVQLFVNSADVEHGADWLPDWLAEHGVAGEEQRARELREALRELVLANNHFENSGFAVSSEALAIVNEAAGRIRLRVDGGVHMEARDALDEVVATMLGAMLDGTWVRLKACRNCHWSFYDYSPNRSATWCSMQLCGNRAKTRAYRKRRTRR